MKFIELYDVAKLPIIDVDGNLLSADFVADNDNQNREIKSVSVSRKFDIIVEFEEEEE